MLRQNRVLLIRDSVELERFERGGEGAATFEDWPKVAFSRETAFVRTPFGTWARFLLNQAWYKPEVNKMNDRKPSYQNLAEEVVAKIYPDDGAAHGGLPGNTTPPQNGPELPEFASGAPRQNKGNPNVDPSLGYRKG
jgi:hypothetical protein